MKSTNLRATKPDLVIIFLHPILYLVPCSALSNSLPCPTLPVVFSALYRYLPRPTFSNLFPLPHSFLCIIPFSPVLGSALSYSLPHASLYPVILSPPSCSIPILLSPPSCSLLSCSLRPSLYHVLFSAPSC